MKIRCSVRSDGTAVLETRTVTPDGIIQPIRHVVNLVEGKIPVSQIRTLQSMRFQVAARGLSSLSKSKDA